MQTLPTDAREFASWTWAQIEPFYRELQTKELTDSNVEGWLKDWSHLTNLLSEVESRLHVATTVNTADEDAEQKLEAFLSDIYPEMKKAEQALKSKLLGSGIEPQDFETPLRNMRADAALFRDENVPLLSEQVKLGTEYDQIIGSQTVVWEGKEVPLPFLNKVMEGKDRDLREKAWRKVSERVLQDRQRLNAMWVKMFELRAKIAKNAGKESFKDYMWSELYRFDYTPKDCADFRDSIAEVVVPVATRIYEKRRTSLGLDTLRPWDTDASLGEEALKPFSDSEELIHKCGKVIEKVDPELGRMYQVMVDERLLDLDSRMNKAPGGYCTNFDAAKLPFIFMNAAGTQSDVVTLLHEAGHAFHVFEAANLPYRQQLAYTSEIAEVASMSMELLGAPFLSMEGGFYSDRDAARARIKHLEKIVLFWPYMAVVDGFQHWAYDNPTLAVQSEECDQAWAKLWDRFLPGIDFTGLEDSRVTGWHRKLHIFSVPFYYVEYGIAQLGAVQVWRNSQSDFGRAVANYRHGLSLGGSKPLPRLFEATGAKFSFDRATLQSAVDLIENTLNDLE